MQEAVKRGEENPGKVNGQPAFWVWAEIRECKEVPKVNVLHFKGEL